MLPGLIKFGEYELDCGRYELRRHGHALKLEKIPMELLILLATSEGQLVTREEIEERLWGKDVFVDAEHGINTAVRKIRQTLGDDPDKPKYVQTVQRKGYRFIATASQIHEASAANGVATKPNAQTDGDIEPALGEREAASPEPLAAANQQVGRARFAKRKVIWFAAAVVTVLAWPVYRFALPRFARGASQPGTIRTIAVLPLENISGDAEQEYFADGMTDELITMLAKYPKMRVISRTSVMQYKKAHKSLPEIARELGVEGIIEGSVSRAQGHVRVRAQLIYAPTDTHLWAESYDRDVGDVLSLQQELARNIAERVNLATSPVAGAGPGTRVAVNLAARDAYYLGRSLWSAGQFDKSEEKFKEVIRLEPNYAAAYAGLADSYTAAAVAGVARPREVIAKSEQAAQKALELDDSEAQAHHSMAANRLFLQWDWEGAEQESERAIAINPGLAELHHLHAYILETLNRVEESLQEDRLCVELDPLGRYWAYAFALYRARRYDEAIKEIEARADMGGYRLPQYERLGLSHAHRGEYAEAVEAWKRADVENNREEAAKALDKAFRERGFSGVMELRYEWQKTAAREHYVSQIHLAEAAAGANHNAEALEYLEKAYEEREPLMVRLLHNPEFDVLHEEPRFKALVKKMRLPGGD